MDLNIFYGRVSVSSSLNVRDSADANGNIIGSLKNNDLVKISRDYSTNKWYSIYFGNKGGFVSKNYIKLTKEDNVIKAKVNVSSSLNVRETPSLNGQILGQLSNNTDILIDLRYSTKDFFSIYYSAKGGFVSVNYITLSDNNFSSNTNNNSTNSFNILVSNKLVDFVKSYEGFFPNHYRDAVGVDTIGYGSTSGWIMNLQTVTEAQATQALMEEINSMAISIKKSLDSKNITLKQNEFDAICSFAYNCGVGALLGSTLYKKICAGVRDSSLKDNFTAWSRAGNQTLQGLFNRRVAEFNIFISGNYIRNS